VIGLILKNAAGVDCFLFPACLHGQGLVVIDKYIGVSFLKTKRPDLGVSGLSVPLLSYGAEQDLFSQFHVVIREHFHV
jgi:hypothetical protein